MWMSTLADVHDIHCQCEFPFAHLLDSIFPDGHKDRNLTIHQIIERDLKQCLSGGEEEERTGMDVPDSAAALLGLKEEKGTTEEDELDALLAAAAEEQEKDTR